MSELRKEFNETPPNYPLYDVQCTGCSFRAQVKTNQSKPKAVVFGAGWQIMNKVLKSGYMTPPLFLNFKWSEKGIVVHIVNGKSENILQRLIAGEKVGTTFSSH